MLKTILIILVLAAAVVFSLAVGYVYYGMKRWE